MKNILATCILFGFIFNSCVPEPLEIELDPIEPQVVVFSQVFPDQYISVLLTQTLDALDYSQEEGDTLTETDFSNLLVDAISVSISYGGKTDKLYRITRGFYVSIETPQIINETYTLNVVLADGKRLTATSQVLPKISFETIEPEIIRNAEDTLVKINYKIADLPGDNWYLLNCYSNRYENNQGDVGLDSLLGSEGNFLKRTELIEDRFYGNNPIEGSIELPEVYASDTLYVTLANITEDYYRFLEVRKNASNLFTELTKEPINSPSNVEGGLGFFNMQFPEISVFNLEEY